MDVLERRRLWDAVALVFWILNVYGANTAMYLTCHR